MKSMFFRNIIWAVDTMEPAEFQKNAEIVLGSIVRATDASVYPAHVLSFPYASPVDKTDFEEAYTLLSNKRLREIGRRSEILNLKTGRTLINRKGSLRSAVDMLLEYADEIDADAIVVSTHSRGAVARLFMGSFAETLLLQSRYPIITINPKSKVQRKISNILFPTTFESKFRPGFERAVELCKSLDASLTVLYKEPFVPALGDAYELHRLLEKEASDRKVQSGRWREWAQNFRVPVEVRLDTTPGNVADEIESYAARNNFDLIVLVSETTDLDGPRAGGVCRKVVRSSECPVWIMKTDEFDEDDII